MGQIQFHWCFIFLNQKKNVEEVEEDTKIWLITQLLLFIHVETIIRLTIDIFTHNYMIASHNHLIYIPKLLTWLYDFIPKVSKLPGFVDYYIRVLILTQERLIGTPGYFDEPGIKSFPHGSTRVYRKPTRQNVWYQKRMHFIYAFDAVAKHVYRHHCPFKWFRTIWKILEHFPNRVEKQPRRLPVHFNQIALRYNIVSATNCTTLAITVKVIQVFGKEYASLRMRFVKILESPDRNLFNRE